MDHLEFQIKGLTEDRLRQLRKSSTRAHSSTAVLVCTVGALAVVYSIGRSYTAVAPHVVIDTERISITSLANGVVTRAASITINGKVRDSEIAPITLEVNGNSEPVNVNGGAFQTKVALAPGRNTIQAQTGTIASNTIELFRIGEGAEPLGQSVVAGGPLDLVVVFDTTSSMGNAIDSVRKSVIANIRRLKEKSKAMRVGLVSFTDHVDYPSNPEAAVRAWPLSDDVERQVLVMNEWQPEGGGDAPEDQLAGIRSALKMDWRSEGWLGTPVTKIIVVVTDDAAKNPDFENNTFESIAELAAKIDPVHIYSIIVKENEKAVEDGKKLAELTGGRALLAADGSAGDAISTGLFDALDLAIIEHAPPPVGLSDFATIGFFVFGLAGVALSLVLIARYERGYAAASQ